MCNTGIYLAVQLWRICNPVCIPRRFNVAELVQSQMLVRCVPFRERNICRVGEHPHRPFNPDLTHTLQVEIYSTCLMDYPRENIAHITPRRATRMQDAHTGQTHARTHTYVCTHTPHTCSFMTCVWQELQSWQSVHTRRTTQHYGVHIHTRTHAHTRTHTRTHAHAHAHAHMPTNTEKTREREGGRGGGWGGACRAHARRHCLRTVSRL